MGRLLRGITSVAFALATAIVVFYVHHHKLVEHSLVRPSLPRPGRAAHCLPPLQSPKPVHPTAPPDIHPSVKAIKTQITSSTDSPHSHAVLLAALHPHTLIAPRPTPFSIVWLSDTQTMSYQRYPGRLAELGKWIDGERAKRGIAYVVQTGDAVENGFSDWQWEEFDTCYNEFKDDLPFFAIAGNHELSIQRRDYSAYLERAYMKNIPSDHAFEGGKAAYTTFTAGGDHFLLIGAGWDSESAAVPWMNNILRKYADYTAILLFHGYIAENAHFTIVGKEMFERVVKPNPNVRLVLCGHICGTAFRSDDLDDNGDGVPDRRVNAMLYDYQDHVIDSGQVRVLTFDPASRGLTVLTYSPPLDRYFRDWFFSSAEFTIRDAY